MQNIEERARCKLQRMVTSTPEILLYREKIPSMLYITVLYLNPRINATFLWLGAAFNRVNTEIIAKIVAEVS